MKEDKIISSLGGSCTKTQEEPWKSEAKNPHYQRKTNNRSQGLIELQYIQLTPMPSNMPPMLEEIISKPTSLKYSPINNQINNLKIILFNIKI